MSSTAPPRLVAALAGRYALERELGAGGMATVYRAEDLKHKRKVAIKVLRPELAAVVGAERFLAEIETTANLQHPHILPLFDSGEADGFLYYVMPWVDGESLRDRLDREKQLPIDEAVDIASKVAGALDEAHQKGVVHRDIKPANILLARGQPLVADFGIALAVQEAGGGRLTETGLSLGTPFYMSPEQATADRDPDARSDLYALACVLYEMLAGEPPFSGGTAQAVLGRILTADPRPPSEVRRSVPPHVEAAVLKALEKTPADRFPDAAAFARALNDPTSVPPGWTPRGARAGSVGGAATGAGGLGRRLPWAVAGLAVAALVWQGLGGGGEDPGAVAPRVRAVLELPENAAMSTWGTVTLTDDGSTLMVSGLWDGTPMVLRRRLDAFEFRPIEGTEWSTYPRPSPDGSGVVLFGQGSGLQRISPEGGLPTVLDPEGSWAAGEWMEDGTIYYSRSYFSGLWSVTADGGEPTQITTPRPDELAHWHPRMLPDGEHLLFSAFRTPIDSARIAVVSLRTGERTDLFEGGVYPRYVATGHIVYARGEALYAVPFDADRLELTGEPTLVVDDVAMKHVDGAGLFDISRNGTLAYLPASDFNAPSDLVWVDRAGRETPAVPDADRFSNPILSPDGREVAVAINEAGTADDVWILDLERGTRQRVTSGGGADFTPRWTPSGAELVYVVERPVFDLYVRRADRSAPARLLVEDAFDKYPTSFTPDGDTLIYFANRPQSEAWKVPVAGGTPEPFFVAEFEVEGPEISPDGRWLAYASAEGGRAHVFLSPYADPSSARIQVSTDGGRMPVWTKGGRELVYRDGRRMMAVAVDPETGTLGRPEVVFEGVYETSPQESSRNFDVTPDGERFLMVKRPPERRARRIVVVTGFFDELRELAGG